MPSFWSEGVGRTKPEKTHTQLARGRGPAVAARGRQQRGTGSELGLSEASPPTHHVLLDNRQSWPQSVGEVLEKIISPGHSYFCDSEKPLSLLCTFAQLLPKGRHVPTFHSGEILPCFQSSKCHLFQKP